jgi:hypothetical protein
MYHSVQKNVQFPSVLLNDKLCMHMYFASELLMTGADGLSSKGFLHC